MLLYDSGEAFVRQEGDILQVEVKEELDSRELWMLCNAVNLALGVYFLHHDYMMMSYNRSAGYLFLVENKETGSAGTILIPNRPVRMVVNLKTVEVRSDPKTYERFSGLMKRFGVCNLPNNLEVEDGAILFKEIHGSFSGIKIYEAVFHIDRAEIEYRIKSDDIQAAPTSPIYVVRDTIRDGEKYLVFKDCLHPFDTVYYSILNDEIRYDSSNTHGNKVAEFWRRVRGGTKILGEDIQIKAIEMLKAKSVDEVLEWYREEHDRMYATLEKNELVRKLFEKLITECHLEIKGSSCSCFVAVLPTDYTTLLLIHDGKCDVLVKEDRSLKNTWAERRRDAYKVLRRLLDGKIKDAIRAAEESGAVKLDEKAAGEKLAEGFKKIKRGHYYTYTIYGGKLHGRSWNSEFKKLPDVLLSRLSQSTRRAVLAALL